MRKILVITGIIGAMVLAACNGNESSNSAADAGQIMDSMVDQATSAVKSAGDSVTRAVQNVSDSAKSVIDSATGDN